MVLATGIWLGVSPVWAQLPIPQLEGPELRLAGQDPLEDRLQALAERIGQKLESRRAANAAVAEALERQAAETSEISSPVTERLAEAHRREVAELERAQELASDGLALLEVEVPKVITASFRELVEAAAEAERLRLVAEQRDARARRLAALGAAPPVRTATTGAGARLADQATRLQAAEAEATLAEALRTRAELRVAQARVDAMRAGLEVGPDAVEAARARLESALADREVASEDLDRLRARLTPELMLSGDDPRIVLRRRAARTELELAARAVANAEARASRARVELAALEGLVSRAHPEYPQEVTADALEAQLAAIAEARLEAETRLSEVRSDLRSEKPRRQRKLLEQIRDALEGVLASLAEESEALDAAVDLQQLLDRRLLGVDRSPEALTKAILLTALVVLVAALLLLRGVPLLQRLETRLGVRARLVKGERLGRRDRILNRFVTFAMVTFPILVVCGAAALVVWPIWQLPFTVGEALSAVDAPLFYVDEQPISVFSLTKLVLTIWITVVLSRVLRRFLVERVFRSFSVDVGFATTLNTFVHYSFLVVGFSIGLRFVGLGLSSFALIAGVLGIGIGFGLRNVTENFISGLIVLVERPIQVGDWIDVNGEVEGQVKNIRARSTTLRTRDNISIIIPNSEFVGRQVTNWSHGDPKVRLRIPVGVVYGSDTDLVRRTLLEVAERYGRVLEKPAPEVQFLSFGASSLDFLLLVWMDQQIHRFRIESDLRFAIDAAFRRKGIVIAFPQLDVHLKTVEADAARVLRGQNAPQDPDKGSIPDAKRRMDKRKKEKKTKSETKPRAALPEGPQQSSDTPAETGSTKEAAHSAAGQSTGADSTGEGASSSVHPEGEAAVEEPASETDSETGRGPASSSDSSTGG